MHRGPDGAGIWISDDGRIGFGHRRLAIIDLSENGAQPMRDPQSGCVVTFNGEIYNYRDLREELRKTGRNFRTSSDTEVLLVAYQHWGDAFVEKLEGMFAFALYDPARRSVLLARDRAGEKPLYVYRDSDTVHFSSEIKAIFIDPRVSRSIDPQGLEQFLALGYATGDTTLVKSVRRMLPGSATWLNERGDELRTWQYWTPLDRVPGASEQNVEADLPSLTRELESVLSAAVERQMASDVPLGVLLSGGLDSSLIAAFAMRAARTSGAPLNTFTVTFPGFPEQDEAGFARSISRHLGTNHIEVEAQQADPALLVDLATQFDDPIADSSMLPTFLVSKAIREHATVALGGDGGDELFGGYTRYSALLRLNELRRRTPAVSRQLLSSAMSLVPESMPGYTTLSGFAAKSSRSSALAGRLLGPKARARLSPIVRAYMTRDTERPEDQRERRIAGIQSVLGQATTLDMFDYLPNDILAKVDRSSMLASLEVRAPLLDASVLRFARERVPDGAKATPEARKLLLRRLAQELLPDDYDVTRKQGFSIPLNRWLCNEWRGFVGDAIDGSPAWLIDASAAHKLWSQVARTGRGGDGLYGVVMLSLWARTYAITE